MAPHFFLRARVNGTLGVELPVPLWRAAISPPSPGSRWAGCSWPHEYQPQQPVPGTHGGERVESDTARTRGGTDEVSLKSGSNQEGMKTGSTPRCKINHKRHRRSFPWSQQPGCAQRQWPTLPSNLLGQVSGPVARLLGGVLAGHVAGGQDASTELSGVLGGVAGLVHDGLDVSQHFCICKRPDRRAAASCCVHAACMA